MFSLMDILQITLIIHQVVFLLLLLCCHTVNWLFLLHKLVKVLAFFSSTIKTAKLTQLCSLDSLVAVSFSSNIQFCTTNIIFLDITNVFQMWLTLVVIRIS